MKFWKRDFYITNSSQSVCKAGSKIIQSSRRTKAVLKMWDYKFKFKKKKKSPCTQKKINVGESLRPIKGKRGLWTWVSEHCCNMSRNSIFVSCIVLCCWYCEVETSVWPWVPVRYKSVGAGQHSSEQVNRASSNPSGGPQSAGAQRRLLQMLTFANMNSLAFCKNKTPPFLREFCKRQSSSSLQAAFASRQQPAECSMWKWQVRGKQKSTRP